MCDDSGVQEQCRVVVCDDVADFRMLLVDILQGTKGFSVVGQAENGREAIDVAGEQRPDVVLLDIAMPVMDGIEALPLIRTASPNSKRRFPDTWRSFAGFAARPAR